MLTVTAAEDGMKLVSFLARRLGGGVTRGELCRWVRTGQVRVNKGRAGIFDRLHLADAVRLPPFAARGLRPEAAAPAEPLAVSPGEELGGGLRALAAAADILALDKPFGLPSQPGSGHETSVVSILRARFSGAVYIPAPAHRLDKNTSGLLLAGKTHAAQEALHALFAAPEDGGARAMVKSYLAWVKGAWEYSAEQRLRDHLAKGPRATPEGRRGTDAARQVCGVREIVETRPENQGKEATSRVSLLQTRTVKGFGPVSLLRIILETGRTHQIRVQLASRGFPVIGDAKYGGPPFSPMLLHAQSLVFPWRGERVQLISPPQWPAPFALTCGPAGEKDPSFFSGPGESGEQGEPDESGMDNRGNIRQYCTGEKNLPAANRSGYGSGYGE
jgi:23S rRNA pseudouridine955/2504/2580 synthase